jgi:hypothetical protein
MAWLVFVPWEVKIVYIFRHANGARDWDKTRPAPRSHSHMLMPQQAAALVVEELATCIIACLRQRSDE